MAMGAVPAKTGQLEAFLHLQPDGRPGAWESFSCHCYRGWAALTARSLDLNLGLKNQHKNRGYLPLTLLSLLPFFQSWRDGSVPLLFYSV